SAFNDTINTSEDTPGAVNPVANDTDPECDTLTVVGNTNGTNGTVACTATSCTYTPNPNFNGTDTFTYTVSDGAQATIGTVNVSISAVNDPPTAVNDAMSTLEDNPVSLN